LVFAIALGGCAAPAVIGTVSTGSPSPATTDATPVDPVLARSLEAAADGARIRHQLVNGVEGSLVIGPIYQSGRGVPCRLGRASPAEAGAATPISYPFCRIGNQWYAMKPVVISGY
jgi:hypothetical protein